MTINKKISAYNNDSRNGNAVKYIVIHDTGVAGQTAKNNVDYFAGGNKNASAHYFVDTDSIWQSVEDSRAAWHVGDGGGKYGITNANSIGIEMCPTASGIPDATQNLCIELVKSLQANYGISNANVIRHYDASRKNCPQYLNLDGKWSAWNTFKAKLTGAATISTGTVTSNAASSGTSYIKNDRVGLYQTAMNTSYKAGLAVDKICGPLSIKAAQAHNLKYTAGMAQIYNAYVRFVQQAFKDLGYDITVDGYYGPKTAAVVKQFQAANGLTVDGIVGSGTLTALLKKFN